MQDEISGSINQGFRINALAELGLGSATVNSSPAPVTIDPQSKNAGLEIRPQDVKIKAVSEIAGGTTFSRTISSVGWDETFDSVQLNFAIPPSWKLLHVSNVTT